MTVVIAFVISVASYFLLPVDRLDHVMQPITVCLSIMAAAVFVRLNRGMPTLDWKTIPPIDRKNLTEEIRKLSLEYVEVLGLASTTILFLMLIAMIGTETLVKSCSHFLVGAFIFCLILTIVRMGYVVWRDYDIIKLQKKIIDDEADRQALKDNAESSEDILKKIKEAQVPVTSNSTLKKWND